MDFVLIEGTDAHENDPKRDNKYIKDAPFLLVLKLKS